MKDPSEFGVIESPETELGSQADVWVGMTPPGAAHSTITMFWPATGANVVLAGTTTEMV